MPRSIVPPHLRVLARIRHDGACWIFTGYRSPLGYGYVNVRDGSTGGRPRLAHRVVYEALVGPIPEGLTLDHLCRRPSCVNPAHLEPVTHAENVRRGSATGRSHARKVCKNGHEMTPENTRLGTRKGWQVRRCRACAREQARVKRAQG